MIIFILIQNTNTLDVKICPQSCLLFIFGQVMKAIAELSSMSETQVGGLIREQFPPNTPPAGRARAREPAPLWWKQNYRVVDLLVNYICLIFTSNVC